MTTVDLGTRTGACARKQPSTRGWTAAAAGFACFVALGAATAHAESLQFCTPEGDPNCIKGLVGTEASVTVTKVNVKQLADTDCPAVERTYKRNMYKDDNQFVRAAWDKRCAYHVRFSTTSSCIGDKDIDLKVADMKAGMNYAFLDLDCGSLKAKKGTFKGPWK
ncbi:MAG: hypothetical protein GC201_00225 [Alphaproteobacteria bacterium]|nr:hypothetical protein [Alphaproteobacteria bacterium]